MAFTMSLLVFSWQERAKGLHACMEGSAVHIVIVCSALLKVWTHQVGLWTTCSCAPVLHCDAHEKSWDLAAYTNARSAPKPACTGRLQD